MFWFMQNIQRQTYLRSKNTLFFECNSSDLDLDWKLAENTFLNYYVHQMYEMFKIGT